MVKISHMTGHGAVLRSDGRLTLFRRAIYLVMKILQDSFMSITIWCFSIVVFLKTKGFNKQLLYICTKFFKSPF